MNIKAVEDILHYEYMDKILLETALTHSSYSYENKTGNYEYLEFLGDSILNMVVTEYLYKNIPEEVGVLSRLKASLVSTDNLISVVEDMKLAPYIRFGKSINLKQVKKAYADVVEAIVASLYFDAGMIVAEDFITEHIIKDKANVHSHLEQCKDYKTMYQEYLQKKGKVKIEYKIVRDIVGNDNMHSIEVALIVDDIEQCKSTAHSSAEASQLCAKKMINQKNA